jgi:hypothetical protein
MSARRDFAHRDAVVFQRPGIVRNAPGRVNEEIAKTISAPPTNCGAAGSYGKKIFLIPQLAHNEAPRLNPVWTAPRHWRVSSRRQ